MMKRIMSVIVFLIITVLSGNSLAQDSGLYVPRNINKAYENKTRSLDGTPGPKYWQNKADYTMNIEFDPESQLLKGEAQITYFNNSPDTLKEMYIHLYPNFFKKGQIRDLAVAYSDESDGVTVENITVNNTVVDTSKDNKKLIFSGTNVKLSLDSWIRPKESIELTISWNYRVVNRGSHQRTGRVDSTSFFIAYFFPHIAVYDDIDGWDNYHYTGLSEFYNDFSSFEVAISVPKDFVVWATGMLQNPAEVLSEKYLRRYQAAMTSDEIIHIVDSTEVHQKNITRQNATNVWHFQAEHVTDFAFATSDHYLWDATSLDVGGGTNKRVVIDAAYNKNSDDFYRVADIARRSIEYMSFEYPAVPFPYPQMTVFNGNSMMEYPMMANDLSVYGIDLDGFPTEENYLISLTAHEIAHSYWPFYIGINEAKYAWMDEGLASLVEFLVASTIDTMSVTGIWALNQYNEISGTKTDLPLFSSSMVTKDPTYLTNSYPKATMFFLMIRDLLGEELFRDVSKEFMDRWKGKHPTPYDLFFTFDQASGQNLNWLFRPWFFEFGYPDLAIKNISRTTGKSNIEIEKIGIYPVPIHLKLTYDDGSSEIIHKKVSVWKMGNSTYSIPVSGNKKISKIELGDHTIPDADMTNNTFQFDFGSNRKDARSHDRKK